MNPKNPPEGIAFFCDDMGKIVEVIQNDLSGEGSIKRDALFPSIVERESMGKALSFLLEIRRNRITSDWELNLTLDRKTLTLHFLGALEHNRMLVVGSLDKSSTLQLFETLTRSEPDDKQNIREFVETRTDFVEHRATVDSLYFDELTRLYNEISNVQRELAKQNVELKR
ncbi:MAG: hypothetical protein PVI66_15745, partial [Candidatus Aminicenantes bacterium]